MWFRKCEILEKKVRELEFKLEEEMAKKYFIQNGMIWVEHRGGIKTAYNPSEWVEKLMDNIKKQL